MTGVPTWPVMAISGMLSSLASAMAVTRFVAPGPLVAMQTPTLPVRAGVALGREPAALLVPRQDRADLVAEAGQRLVQRHAGPARIGENRVHAVVDQALHDDIGPAGGLRIGRLDGERISGWSRSPRQHLRTRKLVSTTPLARNAGEGQGVSHGSPLPLAGEGQGVRAAGVFQQSPRFCPNSLG